MGEKEKIKQPSEILRPFLDNPFLKDFPQALVQLSIPQRGFVYPSAMCNFEPGSRLT